MMKMILMISILLQQSSRKKTKKKRKRWKNQHHPKTMMTILMISWTLQAHSQQKLKNLKKKLKQNTKLLARSRNRKKKKRRNKSQRKRLNQNQKIKTKGHRKRNQQQNKIPNLLLMRFSKRFLTNSIKKIRLMIQIFLLLLSVWQKKRWTQLWKVWMSMNTWIFRWLRKERLNWHRKVKGIFRMAVQKFSISMLLTWVKKQQKLI